MVILCPPIREGRCTPSVSTRVGSKLYLCYPMYADVQSWMTNHIPNSYTPDLVLDKMMELAQNACEARRQEQRKHRKAESRRIGVRGRESELVW